LSPRFPFSPQEMPEVLCCLFAPCLYPFLLSPCSEPLSIPSLSRWDRTGFALGVELLRVPHFCPGLRHFIRSSPESEDSSSHFDLDGAFFLGDPFFCNPLRLSRKGPFDHLAVRCIFLDGGVSRSLISLNCQVPHQACMAFAPVSGRPIPFSLMV